MEIFGFLVIFKESLQLIPRNGKLLALTTIPYFVISSILFSILNFKLKFLIHEIALKVSILSISTFKTSTFTRILANIKEDFRILLTIYVAVILVMFLVTFLYAVTTVILSYISYNKTTISLKDYVLRISKASRYAIITALYTKMLGFGYIFIILILLTPLLISSSNIFLFLTGILVGIIAFFFFQYLSVVWTLALVISVVEEDCYGFKAIAKAGGLIKGKRLTGFMLNILSSLVSIFLYQSYMKMNRGAKGVVNQTLVSLFLVNCSSFVNFLSLVAYTVLYFHCKKNNGEEVELQLNYEYNKV